MNLGWKLGQVVRAVSPDALLDTYHAERYPAVASVLRTTMALTALARGDDRTEALREYMQDLLEMRRVRNRIAAEMSGLGVQYDLGGTHPLVGRPMPDLDIVVGGIARRVFEFLREPIPLFFRFAGSSGSAIDLQRHLLRWVEATTAGSWKLPGIGIIRAPDAVLVHPDGHVAWVSEGSDEGLSAALNLWCGVRSTCGSERASGFCPERTS